MEHYSSKIENNLLKVEIGSNRWWLIDTTLDKSISYEKDVDKVIIDEARYSLIPSENKEYDVAGVIGLDIIKKTSLTIFEGIVGFYSEMFSERDFKIINKANAIVIECEIDGKKAKVLFDSKSDKDYISSKYYNKVSINALRNTPTYEFVYDEEKESLMNQYKVDAIIGFNNDFFDFNSKFGKYLSFDFDEKKYKIY